MREWKKSIGLKFARYKFVFFSLHLLMYGDMRSKGLKLSNTDE